MACGWSKPSNVTVALGNEFQKLGNFTMFFSPIEPTIVIEREAGGQKLGSFSLKPPSMERARECLHKLTHCVGGHTINYVIACKMLF